VFVVFFDLFGTHLHFAYKLHGEHLEGEPPENEKNGGAAAAANMGVRPHNEKNDGPPGFPLISPSPATPTPTPG
jgi:hypothetical protein